MMNVSRMHSVAASIAFGFLLGVISMFALDAADPYESVRQARVEATKAIEDTKKREAALTQEEKKVEVQIRYVTKEIVKYVPATQDTPADCRLNAGAVGLLNSARTGSDFQPSLYSFDQVTAFTDIGLRELSQSDIEIAHKYRELQARHNALVDYVTDYQERLRKYFQ